jgi:tetratricopeptide (TPR) repeat protein
MKIHKLLVVFLTASALMATLEMRAIANPATARIKNLIGKVELKRMGWKKFRTVAKGTELYLGDLILLAADAKVRVICPDLTERPVPAGVQSGLRSICPNISRQAGRNPSPADGTLGGINAKIPYIISPRRTLLLSKTPTFKWNAVAEVKQYKVQVIAPTGIIWETQVSKPEVIYPGNPQLQPGVSYSLVIKADNGTSSESDGSSGLGFHILHDEEIKALQAEIAALPQKELTTPTIALTLANLYRNYTLSSKVAKDYGIPSVEISTHNLSAESIDLLKVQIEEGNCSPAIYRMLGDVYWQTGLAQLASRQYLKAIELAKTPEDLEDQTEAQFSLGEIYAAIKDLPEAIRWYGQANDGYAALGDPQRVKFLDRQIESLRLTIDPKPKP